MDVRQVQTPPALPHGFAEHSLPSRSRLLPDQLFASPAGCKHLAFALAKHLGHLVPALIVPTLSAAGVAPLANKSCVCCSVSCPQDSRFARLFQDINPGNAVAKPSHFPGVTTPFEFWTSLKRLTKTPEVSSCRAWPKLHREVCC